MDDETYSIIMIVILWVALIANSFIGITQVERYRNERSSLVQQTCDYAQVANTDTVTELCTKYQQQTNTVYLQEIGGNSRVEAK